MSDMRIGIAATNQAFVSAFSAGDSAGIAALYTEAGQLLPPNSEPVVGHHAIAAFWQGAMDMGIGSATLETVEVEGFGDTAVEIGRYSLAAADGSPMDHGKFMVIWKNEGGWKLHHDIWNSSVAPSE